MISNLGTLKGWYREARAAGTLSIGTGNHHLFLIVKTKSDQEWIVLLGKRRPNFPFFGCRFENATFYNVSQNILYHHASEEIPDLKFDCKKTWELSGKKPFDFSFSFLPKNLDKRHIFLKRLLPLESRHIPGATFNYHTLQWDGLKGSINGEILAKGHGFSEAGSLSILTLQDWRPLFYYTLILEREGDGGTLQWRAKTLPPKNLVKKLPYLIKKHFLHDQFNWGGMGEIPPSESIQTLATTHVPFKDWTLKRDIVMVKKSREKIAYGLYESFIPD